MYLGEESLIGQVLYNICTIYMEGDLQIKVVGELQIGFVLQICRGELAHQSGGGVAR